MAIPITKPIAAEIPAITHHFFISLRVALSLLL